MWITVHSDKGHDAFLLEPRLFTPHIHQVLNHHEQAGPWGRNQLPRQTVDQDGIIVFGPLLLVLRFPPPPRPEQEAQAGGVARGVGWDPIRMKSPQPGRARNKTST